MQKSQTSPDEFLASLADGVREDMTTLDAEIARVMTGHERVLWEGTFWGGTEQHIIGYGTYSYKDSKGKQGEWFVVGLAAQKNYLTVYVNAVVDGKNMAEAYSERLGKAKIGRSTITFKRLADIDLPVLVELLTAARSPAPGS
ncbi:MAG TPA: DUF1801 domain-containing protein [Candidatus Limnocylindrales bacterium]|nr:DUF1801 domain-containing protein [Candidatus Limnocylindrales bacterium]